MRTLVGTVLWLASTSAAYHPHLGARTVNPATSGSRRAPPSHRCRSPVASASEDAETPPAPAALKYLPAAAAVGTVGTTLLHAPAFARFVEQWQAISASGVAGEDFSAPLQFWTFFAFMHPLLQPALWISEVLHGSPGPQIGEILPITFLIGNIVAIGALQTVAELRTAANIAVLGLFINYIGSGLDGTGGLGDYNLALDDGVMGCPTYEQVRQPTMDAFDKDKYTGRWYEHAFHDWTQFSDTCGFALSHAHSHAWPLC
jgi:hypothetical protein